MELKELFALIDCEIRGNLWGHAVKRESGKGAYICFKLLEMYQNGMLLGFCQKCLLKALRVVLNQSWSVNIAH